MSPDFRFSQCFVSSMKALCLAYLVFSALVVHLPFCQLEKITKWFISLVYVNRPPFYLSADSVNIGRIISLDLDCMCGLKVWGNGRTAEGLKGRRAFVVGFKILNPN